MYDELNLHNPPPVAEINNFLPDIIVAFTSA